MLPLLYAVMMNTMAAPLPDADATGITLIEKGQPRAVIYVDGPLKQELEVVRKVEQAPSTPEGYRGIAVAELNEHFKLMAGVELPVVLSADSAEIPQPAIVLGAPARRLGAEPTATNPSQEGFRLLVRDGRVLIAGESDAGMLHGVYELLRQLGCDWVMPGEIGRIVPQQPTVRVPGLDIASAPDFQARRLWYRGYPNRQPEEFSRMNRWLLRQRGFGTLPARAETAGHFWGQLIKQNQAEFDAHPEMYALVRDRTGQLVRKGPQLETTNERVIELFVKTITDTYERNIAAGKWTRETEAGFPVGPSDGLGYSLSSEAAAAGAGRIDPIVGELDRTDELILLCNRILARVLPQYPNAYVGYYSYSTHADFPLRYQPHPHITQIFAPINFSRFHSILDDHIKTQAYYRQVVELWGQQSQRHGNPLVYRGYNWNLADNMLPYTKVRIWGEELPYYHRMNVLGMNVEATKSWSILAPSDYIFMRLAWDSSLDWRELLQEFCAKAYGPAAQPMLDYHLLLAQRQYDAGMEAGSFRAFHLMYDAAWIAQARQLFAQAQQLAQTDDQRTRIGFVKHSVDALALFLDFQAACMRLDFAAAQAGYDAMLAHWQQAYDQNSDLVAGEVPAYLKRFLSAFVAQGLTYSSGEYRIVHPIPDELPTLFDPQVVGASMNYHLPQLVDAKVERTHTFTSTWDAQGLGGLRDGAVWYRHRFTLTGVGAAEPIGLFVGGVEDEARVWINGQLIGAGRGFSKPMLFDLTEGIDRKGENLLAIQVVRNSKANEIGLGGIISPCFLFAGPRLPQAAPTQVDLRRVLPGGELGDTE